MTNIFLWTAFLALVAMFLLAIVVRGTRRRVFRHQPLHPYRAQRAEDGARRPRSARG